MSLDIKSLHGENLQVEDDIGRWVIFSLDELRSRSIDLPADRVEGSPALSPDKADLFVWAAFAAARGYAVEHGLIEDDRPPSRA